MALPTLLNAQILVPVGLDLGHDVYLFLQRPSSPPLELRFPKLRGALLPACWSSERLRARAPQGL